MRKDELAAFNIRCGKVSVCVELVSFRTSRQFWQLTQKEHLELASAQKDAGTAYLESGLLNDAIRCYGRGVQSAVLARLSSEPTEDPSEGLLLLRGCYLNLALSHLRTAEELGKEACLGHADVGVIDGIEVETASCGDLNQDMAHQTQPVIPAVGEACRLAISACNRAIEVGLPLA